MICSFADGLGASPLEQAPKSRGLLQYRLLAEIDDSRNARLFRTYWTEATPDVVQVDGQWTARAFRLFVKVVDPADQIGNMDAEPLGYLDLTANSRCNVWAVSMDCKSVRSIT